MNKQDSQFTAYEPKHNSRFVVKMDGISPYTIHSYYPPSSKEDLKNRQFIVSCYEKSSGKLLEILSALSNPSRDKFDVIVSFVDAVGTVTERHEYKHCCVENFDYPPFSWSDNEIRSVNVYLKYDSFICRDKI